jgi:hypothetical protein
VVIQYSASLATKRLTMLAMISPTSAAIRIVPSDDRSRFVVAPMKASVANMPAVTRNVVKIDCAV